MDEAPISGLVVGAPGLAQTLRALGFDVHGAATIREGFDELPRLTSRSFLVVSDVAPLGGARRRRALATAAVMRGHQVLVLASWSGAKQRALLPFGELASRVSVMGPDVLEREVLQWLGLQANPTDGAAPVAPSQPLFANLPHESAARGWKRITLELGPRQRVAVAGAFSGARVGFEADAACDLHEHPRGIVDPQLPCFGGFSAHTERLYALSYAPSDGPLAQVSLSGNVALVGPLATSLDFCGERQRVDALEFVAACVACVDYTPTYVLSGNRDADGWASLYPRCEGHQLDIAITAEGLPSLLERSAGRPIPVTWRTGMSAQVLHRVARRQVAGRW